MNDREFIFQQDPSKPHTSKITTKFLRDKKLNVLEWPPASADMSIIEHMWYYLKKRLSDINTRDMEEDELIELAKKEWKLLGKGLIKYLYDSYPRRIKVLWEADGGFTKY